MRRLITPCFILIIIHSCSTGLSDKAILPEVPAGAQAISLLGDTLIPWIPTEESVSLLEEARKEVVLNRNDADKLIWYGRRTAYTGDYRGAIRIFSMGIRKFPDDARFLRHRGHRYITLREFDRALDDLEKAALLVMDKPDETEPDGMPNVLDIPLSTLKTNIYYHLALACYLKADYENALSAWNDGLYFSPNADMIVANSYWIYMSLRLLGRESEARQSLEYIHPGMEIIENHAYYKLCLLFKGLPGSDEPPGYESPETFNEALAYGLGNWHLFNGNMPEARRIFTEILSCGHWASFGYIAAEAALAGMD